MDTRGRIHDIAEKNTRFSLREASELRFAQNSMDRYGILRVEL